MKILIIQTAFIGDVILATSFIELVASYFPDSEIDFLLKKGHESILDNNPHIGKTHTWNKNKKYRSLFNIYKNLRKNDWDIVFNLQRFSTTGFLTAVLNSKEKIGFFSNPLSCFYTRGINHQIPSSNFEESVTHEVQRNESLLQSISYHESKELKALKPRLYFSDKQKDKVFSLVSFDQYITIAPASVWKTKTWPKESWRKLINSLQDQKICLIGAANDFELCEELKGGHSNILNLCGKLELIESALLIKNSKIVIAQDSSVLHLASAVNTPTRAIFCSTVKEFGFFPLSDDSQIIEVKEKLNCRPCGLHGKKECPLEHFKCSKDIKVDDVLKTLGTSS